ncbi:peptidyl-tRNA hydrolase [Genypterus blacodes]|uniref:peptidyl-tRNA hydrolase n=1 Tax=Genypterus blacodes TaxID=154954 RepID=UPI003F776AB8
MKTASVFSRICRCMSQFFSKLLNFVTMRRLLTRMMNRVLLLSDAVTPAEMSQQAETHTHHWRMVVGLGNPGMEGTRHSVGMAVLGELAARLGVADRWRGDKHVSGEVIVSKNESTAVVLLRPKLLMNINGVSVAKAAGKYGVKPEDILLIHDDLDKALGKLSIKHGGSASGHNGVRSCIDCLQTDVMLRLRVGIGRPAAKTAVERYVLGRFSSEERKVLGSVLAQSVDLLLSQLLLDSQSPSSPPEGRRAVQGRKGRERSASPAQESASAQS